MALSAVLAVLGVALVVVGLSEGTPTKVILGVVVVGGGLARIVIERRRGR